MSKRFVRVASRDEVPPGTLLGVEAHGERIVVCNVDGVFYAVRDECTHESYPLSAGELNDKTLTCVLHGARFDIETGEVLALPAYESLKTYEIKVEGEEIMVAVD